MLLDITCFNLYRKLQEYWKWSMLSNHDKALFETKRDSSVQTGGEGVEITVRGKWTTFTFSMEHNRSYELFFAKAQRCPASSALW